MEAYFDGLQKTENAIQTDNLVPIISHVVERHREAMDECVCDEPNWQYAVSNMVGALESLISKCDVKSEVLIRICNILRDIASKRYDNYVCESLRFGEIYNRLHLEALFCLTYVVTYRLRDKTPPEVLETLTAAAKLDGQEGEEHRTVLGFALVEGLRHSIPNWYEKNESILFGKDSPTDMNTTLIRVCADEGTHVCTDTVHRVLDVQTMEKYHKVVLTALGEEMQDVRRRASETGNRVERNNLVGHFMRHVLHGSRGYGIEDSVQNLSHIGSDIVSIAGHECGQLIHSKDTDKELVSRGVQFWKTVLDSSPKPDALYGFGWWHLVECINRDTWEGLMLRTCKITGSTKQ